MTFERGTQVYFILIVGVENDNKMFPLIYRNYLLLFDPLYSIYLQ